MATPSFTEIQDTLYTTTWRAMRETAVDNISQLVRLWYWLFKNNRVSLNGGRRIDIPVMYELNSTVTPFTKGHQFDVVDTDPLTTLQYNWTNIGVSMVRYWTDERDNSGKHQIINMLRSKVQNAKAALEAKLEEYSFGDGSGTNEPDGLQKLVDSTPATGTVGGLNAANYSWWRNNQKTATGAASTYLESDMRNAYNACLVEKGKPDYIITDQTSWELYDDEMLEYARLVNNKMGDAEFQSLGWKGIPIVWSPDCPSGYMYFLDSRHLDLVLHPAANFVMTPWRDVPNQLDRVAYIVARYAIVTDKRNAHNVLTGIAA